jgi:hypothetical protein
LHTLQWVIVEADDEDTATNYAESLLNEELGSVEGSTNTWFDWFVVGGGRWNPEQDQYANSSNMVISYDKDPNGFYAKIQELIGNRIDTYNEYLAEFKGQEDIFDKLNNYGGVMTYDPSFYALSRLIAYQQGNWDYDSKFYDLVHWSTNATHILGKIANNEGKNLFLVPIDFHF